MKTRQMVNKKIDRKVFRKTAAQTNSKNIPGKVVYRGGVRLWLSKSIAITIE